MTPDDRAGGRHETDHAPGRAYRLGVATCSGTWARQTPDAPMLTEGATTLSWAEVYGRARRVSRGPDRGRRGAGDRVAFLDRNGIEYFEVFFGCALLGAVSVAVNWRLAPMEMAAIIEDAGAPVVFFGPDYAAAVKEIGPAVDRVSAPGCRSTQFDAVAGRGARAPRPGLRPGLRTGPRRRGHPALHLGHHRPAQGSHDLGRNISCILTEADRVFHIGTDTVSLVAMPLFHIGGTGWALCGMSRGGHSVILRDMDPVAVAAADRGAPGHRDLRRAGGADVPAGHPGAGHHRRDLAAHRLLRRLAHQRGRAGPVDGRPRMRLRPGLRADRDDRGHHLAHARRPRPRRAPGRIAAVGRPPLRPRASCGSSTPTPDEHLPVGEVGEVWTRSDQNMLGYWNKPEETAAVLSDDGWFRTGDAGWLDADGYLFLHDRIKDMIVSGGENVYPAEVENALLSHPGGGRCRRHRGARRPLGRDGQGHRGQGPRGHRTTRRWPPTSSPPPAPAWPTTSARPRSTSWTPCPATRRARCSSASCAQPYWDGRERNIH